MLWIGYVGGGGEEGRRRSVGDSQTVVRDCGVSSLLTNVCVLLLHPGRSCRGLWCLPALVYMETPACLVNQRRRSAIDGRAGGGGPSANPRLVHHVTAGDPCYRRRIARVLLFDLKLLAPNWPPRPVAADTPTAVQSQISQDHI
jgi:hypothetical protein